MNIIREYENFLDLRRQETFNFFWISRRWDPQLTYHQAKVRPTPQSHKEAVLKSPKIQELLDQLSSRSNVAKSVLETQVRDILDEIGYDKKLKIIRWLALVLTKICLKVLEGIYVSVEQVRELKKTIGNCPVIFVPTHRSYGDFIMMAYIPFQYDIEIPAVAAGMDFHGMWGMGTLLRDTGAFFMRRSYNNDELYWTTFREYVYQLVNKGDSPIEFFIEGTRSRSNKSLSPKYGLLSMVLKPFFFSQVPDILFVPVNINYDRILEESLFAFELLGVPKPKESTAGFLKSLKILKESFGNIHAHIDKPISAREFFGDKLDRSVHNSKALHQQEVTENEKRLLPTLAFEILDRQQKVLVVTVFNLMALVMNNNLAYQKQLLGPSEVIEEVKWVRDVLETLGGYCHTDNVEKSVRECLATHQNLVAVNEEGRLRLVGNEVSQGEINHKKLKAHPLSDKTMTYAVPFVMLQIYINPILHYFVDINVILTVLGGKTLNEDELYENYQFLRFLFSREFVTLLPKDRMAFSTALNRARSLNLVKATDGEYQSGNNEKLAELILNTFETFYASFLTTLVVLEKLPEITDEKSILANAQMVLENAISVGDNFVHPYSLNLDSLGNCLSNLVDVSVLRRSRRDNRVMYETNKIKLRIIKGKFENYVPKYSIEEICQINLEPLNNKM